MKRSLKPLASFISILGISLGISLPTLAQTPSGPSQPDPNSDSSPRDRATPVAPGGMNNEAPSRPPVPAAPGGISVSSTSSSETIDTIVRQSPSFELFNALVRVADQKGVLSSILGGDSDYTVFAPTDQALAMLPAGTFKALVQPENRDLLISILENHVVKGKVLSTQLSGQEIRSLDGNPLPLGRASGGVTIGNAPVVAADIQASNGVIHAINGIILPPDVQSRLVGLTPQPIAPSAPVR